MKTKSEIASVLRALLGHLPVNNATSPLFVRADELAKELEGGKDPAVHAFPGAAMADEVGIDWGSDGCYTISAKDQGRELLGGVFPGRGRESLDKAVLLCRLLAEASGGAKVVGPVGLVEAVEHAGGVAGVLGLDRPAEGALIALGEAAQRANEASKHLRARPADLLGLLRDCLHFIQGFEDDDTQGEGAENVVPGLLERLRAVVPGEMLHTGEFRTDLAPIVPAIETGGAALVVFHDGKELLSVDLERDGVRAKERVHWANTESASAGNVMGLCVPMSLVLACAGGPDPSGEVCDECGDVLGEDSLNCPDGAVVCRRCFEAGVH